MSFFKRKKKVKTEFKDTLPALSTKDDIVNFANKLTTKQRSVVKYAAIAMAIFVVYNVWSTITVLRSSHSNDRLETVIEAIKNQEDFQAIEDSLIWESIKYNYEAEKLLDSTLTSEDSAKLKLQETCNC